MICTVGFVYNDEFRNMEPAQIYLKPREDGKIGQRIVEVKPIVLRKKVRSKISIPI